MRTPPQKPPQTQASTAPTIKIKGLYKRGTTYWYARQLNGKRDFVSLETSDPFEAVKKIAALNGAEVLSDGSHLEFAVDEYTAFCKRTGNWSEASVEAKRPVLRAWAKWAGKIPPSEVTTEDMRAYHDMRCKSVTASTAYGNLMTIQSFFNWCTEIKRTCATNPVLPLTFRRSKQKIKTPKPGVRKKFCTPELRDRLIAECRDAQLRYILFCGFHSGLRKNEIIESKAEWFDLKAGLLHLTKHAGIAFKDNEERTIPLTEAFGAFLKKFKLEEPYVIAPDTQKGRSRYRYDFKRPFAQYMEEKGCPWVTPHVMRHTFASLLASAGCSIFKIAEWMGDDVKVVQKHYAKLLPNDSEIEVGFRPPSEVTRRPPDKPASKPRGTRRSQKE